MRNQRWTWNKNATPVSGQEQTLAELIQTPASLLKVIRSQHLACDKMAFAKMQTGAQAPVMSKKKVISNLTATC